jgi:hypothetical protein
MIISESVAFISETWFMEFKHFLQLYIKVKVTL